MSSVADPKKVYVSNIPRVSRERDIAMLFQECGRISKIQHHNTFAFVEYVDARDAEECLKRLNGLDFMGRRLRVEQYRYRGGDPRYRPSLLLDGQKENGRRGRSRERERERDFPHHRARFDEVGQGYRVVVSGLSTETSWQDLKDFGRQAGRSVIFADVFESSRGDREGVIEFGSRSDYDYALRSLDSTKLMGVRVKVSSDNTNKHRRSRSNSLSKYRRVSRSRSRGNRRSRSRSRSRGRYRERRSLSKDRRRSRSYSRGEYREPKRDRSLSQRSPPPPPRDRSRSRSRGGDNYRKRSQSPNQYDADRK